MKLWGITVMGFYRSYFNKFCLYLTAFLISHPLVPGNSVHVLTASLDEKRGMSQNHDILKGSTFIHRINVWNLLFFNSIQFIWLKPPAHIIWNHLSGTSLTKMILFSFSSKADIYEI